MGTSIRRTCLLLLVAFIGSQVHLLIGVMQEPGIDRAARARATAVIVALRAGRTERVRAMAHPRVADQFTSDRLERLCRRLGASPRATPRLLDAGHSQIEFDGNQVPGTLFTFQLDGANPPLICQLQLVDGRQPLIGLRAWASGPGVRWAAPIGGVLHFRLRTLVLYHSKTGASEPAARPTRPPSRQEARGAGRTTVALGRSQACSALLLQIAIFGLAVGICLLRPVQPFRIGWLLACCIGLGQLGLAVGLEQATFDLGHIWAPGFAVLSRPSGGWIAASVPIGALAYLLTVPWCLGRVPACDEQPQPVERVVPKGRWR